MQVTYLARKRRERAWQPRKRRWRRRRRACGYKNLHWPLGKRPNCGACWRLYPWMVAETSQAPTFQRILYYERRSVTNGGRRVARGEGMGCWRMRKDRNKHGIIWPPIQGQFSQTCRLKPLLFSIKKFERLVKNFNWLL